MFRRVRLERVALAACLVVVCADRVSGQALVDPRRVEFTPSVDHNTLEADGTPRLEFYQFDLYISGQPTRIDTIDLGKPNPESDGKIRVDFIALLSPPLTPGIVYSARITSVGPGGITSSDLSNTFTLPVPCAPTIAPASTTVAAAGGSGTVAVTTDAGCAWSATSNTSWLTIASGASGNGAGSVGFSAAANTSASSRTGSLTVAGRTFTVTQSGVSCAYTVAPLTASVVAGGASGTVSVTAPAGCNWTASSNASWITVTAGATGSGNGTVTYSASANAAAAARSGTFLAAGATVTLTQAAAACSYSVSPTSRVVTAIADAGTFDVTAPAGCTWSATTAADWVSIAGGTGSGPGTITFATTANTSVSSRSTTIAVASASFTLTQAGMSCSYTLTPNNQTFASAGGTTAVVIATTSGCSWSATSNVSWISVTGGSGVGPGSTALTVGANTTAALRSGTATIAGRTFTVNQTGAGCTYLATPDSLTLVKTGSQGQIQVSVGAGCSWTPTTTASWLTVSGSGPGSGTVTYTATANPLSYSRTATIVIASRRVWVTQSGAVALPAPPANLRLLPKGN